MPAGPTPLCTGPHCTPIKCNGLERPPQVPLVDPAYEKATAFLGTTPDEIQQKFASIQELNFTQGNAQQVVSRLSDAELHDLAYFYNRSAPVGSSTLLRTFAKKLDGASLIRIAMAFGSDATQSAVQAYAPAQVQADFAQRLAVTSDIPTDAPFAPSTTMGGGGAVVDSGSPPNANETFPEIYMDYRTAPVGSQGAAVAIAETTLFSGTDFGPLLEAGWDGYEIGTQIHDLIEQYDPALDDVIGGTIAQAVENIDEAENEWDQGDYESAADDLFGGPIDETGDFDGDWDVGESYEFYESGSGGCG